MKKRDFARLRRLAEGETAGKPDRIICSDNRGCERLSDHCTRGLYKTMKRAAQRGEIPFARARRNNGAAA